jgi:hypothetical protein
MIQHPRPASEKVPLIVCNPMPQRLQRSIRRGRRWWPRSILFSTMSPSLRVERRILSFLVRLEASMALTGGSCLGTYEGHVIELVQNNWNKTLKLFIDGKETARASCLFPGARTLTATLMHNGVPHAVTAKSVPHRLVLTRESIQVDGSELPLNYKSPQGLLKAAFQDVRTGHGPSLILVAALGVGVLVLLVVLVTSVSLLLGRGPH